MEKTSEELIKRLKEAKLIEDEINLKASILKEYNNKLPQVMKEQKRLLHKAKTIPTNF
jgi:hypothetical protein